MRKLIISIAVCLATTGCSATTSAPMNSDKNGTKPHPVENWDVAADSCTFVLTDQFLNKEKGTFWGSAHNEKNNSSVLYWQQAHAMDVVVYAYERVKNTDHEKAAEYENYFRLWFKNHANNWYSWKEHGDTTGFLNEFTDDMCWIALTMLHMTEATGDETYYKMAKEIYDTHIITRAREDKKGWGLPWKSNDMGRNACTNTPGCAIACKLYLKTREQKYFDDARKLYAYIVNNLLKADFRVEEPPLTYTQGTFAEAARLLYHITKDRDCLTNAEKVVLYTISSDRCTHNGLLRDEGDSEDQSIFKAVFVPYAVNLVLDEAASFKVRDAVKMFLLQNARSLWNKHVDRKAWPRMFCDFYWGDTYSTQDDLKYKGSMGAQTSGASLLENMARMMKE